MHDSYTSSLGRCLVQRRDLIALGHAVQKYLEERINLQGVRHMSAYSRMAYP